MGMIMAQDERVFFDLTHADHLSKFLIYQAHASEVGLPSEIHYSGDRVSVRKPVDDSCSGEQCEPVYLPERESIYVLILVHLVH